MLKKLIALSLLLVAGQAIAQTAAKKESAFSEEFKKNLKERVEQNINPGIVVAFIDGGKIEYYSVGVKSLKTKEPVSENSVFEIGSVTKTFTGILLASKVLKGEVKLDDPLQKYLPEGITAPTRNGESIKLLNMSNHTSSLPRMPFNFAPKNPANPFADYSEKQMYDFLVSYTLPRDIGSQYEYSNFAQGLLGHVLAVKSGVTYEQLMLDVIAKPLGMKNTRTTFTPEMKQNLAMGHSGNSEVENWDLVALAGAGAIRSTAVDMVKYVSANMGLTKSDVYPAMQLSHTNTSKETIPVKVGLGWHIAPAGDKEIVWHNGGTGGYRSYIGFIRGEQKGVVVLTNSTTGIDDIGVHLLNPSSPLKAVDKPITVDASILERYVGKYEIAPSFIITITREGSQLNAQATAQPQFPVFAKSNNVFYFKVVEAQLTFNENNGVIESMTLNQNGQQLTGKRMPN